MPSFLVTIISIIVLIILFIVIGSMLYRKVGPNEVLIVTGGLLKGKNIQENADLGTHMKVVKGGGAFVIPVIQQANVYSLDTFNINADVEEIMTVDSVPVDASVNAVLRIGSTPELIAIAAEKIMGLSDDELSAQMIEVVKGGLREVLSSLTPKEANDRSAFQTQVVRSIEATFANMGLEITSLQITRISDKHGYYESLSAGEIAEKQANAKKLQASADAEARKEIAQRDKEARLVEAQNTQEAQQAKARADKEIAQTQRDTNVAKAEYNADVNQKNAVAEQAGEIEKAKQQQQVSENQIIVAQNKFKATTIASQEADAQSQRIAADAQAYTTRQTAEANAAKIQAEGKASADAQRMMSQALAENDKALQQQLIDKLPEIMSAYASAIANIDNLTVFDGAQGVGDQMNTGFVQSSQFIKQATGIDIAEIVGKRADGRVSLNEPVPTKETTQVQAEPKQAPTAKDYFDDGEDQQ
ncbi:flotillin [Ligilactobacillus pabuli]|uniref:Flotillin n=1 Tax=Ligilactobacillus pabuli TaxID=2886039 RepID=A0ABQ5JJ45_9LACO|nr:flotillin family protein [Ligilactobacillus pabuli]GKS81100.1 flotillin [Ligilactobacillus pabuli]